MFKVFKSTFVLNTLGVFVAFIFAAQSYSNAFIDTEKLDEFSSFGYFSTIFCTLSVTLIWLRWKKLKLIPRIISVLIILFALQGPIALIVTYVEWFHQFDWLYSSQINGGNNLTQDLKYFAIFGGLCSSSVKWQMSKLSISFNFFISVLGSLAGFCNMLSMDVSISRFSVKAISQFEHSRPLWLLEKYVGWAVPTRVFISSPQFTHASSIKPMPVSSRSRS